MTDQASTLCSSSDKSDKSVSLTNKQQFSMLCSLIDHRNDVKIFKIQVEQLVAGECFKHL